jgi:disulfide bond formation protein DsbB
MKVRSAIFVVALLAVALLVAACGGGAAKPVGPAVSSDAQKFTNLKGDAAKGKPAYVGTCSACHGPDAKGVTGLGKDLTKSEFAMKLSDADFVLFITKGRPSSDPLNTTKVDMPPRGGNPALKDQDLADIVAFVRTLQK